MVVSIHIQSTKHKSVSINESQVRHNKQIQYQGNASGRRKNRNEIIKNNTVATKAYEGLRAGQGRSRFRYLDNNNGAKTYTSAISFVLVNVIPYLYSPSLSRVSNKHSNKTINQLFNAPCYTELLYAAGLFGYGFMQNE